MGGRAKGVRAQRGEEAKKKGRFYRMSTQIFISEGNEVFKYLINLPPLTFHKHEVKASRLFNYHDHHVQFQVCPTSKCLATRDL